MIEFGDLQGTVALVLSLVLFGVKAFALVDAIGRNPNDFTFSDTQLTKQAWLIILVLAVAAHLVLWYPLGLLNLLGTVAALVYLAQLRGSRW